MSLAMCSDIDASVCFRWQMDLVDCHCFCVHLLNVTIHSDLVCLLDWHNHTPQLSSSYNLTVRLSRTIKLEFSLRNFSR